MFVSVDIEADGPVPGMYSMLSLGAVVVEPSLSQTFYATFRPQSANYIPEALAVSGFTREQTLHFPIASIGMCDFYSWLENIQRPMFVSDNNGFDWMFVCYYFYEYLGRNPFGHSSTNLSSLYKGMEKSCFVNFKHLRKTEHNHNALQDAIGNAEALLEMKKMGLKFK